MMMWTGSKELHSTSDDQIGPNKEAKKWLAYFAHFWMKKDTSITLRRSCLFISPKLRK